MDDVKPHTSTHTVPRFFLLSAVVVSLFVAIFCVPIHFLKYNSHENDDENDDSTDNNVTWQECGKGANNNADQFRCSGGGGLGGCEEGDGS